MFDFCLPTKSTTVPSGADWLHEIKYDGYRLRLERGRVRLVTCGGYDCSPSTAISGDRWPDEVRLSEVEARFVRSACGKRGADVRPDFNWNKGEAPSALGVEASRPCDHG